MAIRKTTLSDINQRIILLQKKREALTLKSALLLNRELHKFFGHPFEPEFVLTILKDTWEVASDSQKKEWQNKMKPFPAEEQKRSPRSKTSRPTAEESPPHASP